MDEQDETRPVEDDKQDEENPEPAPKPKMNIRLPIPAKAEDRLKQADAKKNAFKKALQNVVKNGANNRNTTEVFRLMLDNLD